MTSYKELGDRLIGQIRDMGFEVYIIDGRQHGRGFGVGDARMPMCPEALHVKNLGTEREARAWARRYFGDKRWPQLNIYQPSKTKCDAVAAACGHPMNEDFLPDSNWSDAIRAADLCGLWESDHPIDMREICKGGPAYLTDVILEYVEEKTPGAAPDEK